MAIELTPQGAVPAIGIPNSQDTARLVFSAPYFDTVPIAEIILPSVEEAVQAILPSLVPPYVDQAAQAAVQQSAVLLTGSTMSGPLNLSPLLPVSDSMAATKAYVDTMVSTAGVPEVPAVPVGQSWVRQTGQWAPLATSPGGPFLALSGGAMQGQINMSGNAITNLPAVPVMPNGAAPATWVLNQIASVSLYQGTWNLDTFTPDLTQPSTHINGYTWIAITNAPAGVVISPAVPGLQGMTVYNGDTVIFSAAQGGFSAIHAGGLTAPQADARYLMLVGGQLSGALLLNANASAPLQAVTLQQLQAFVPPGIVPEAPGDGQLYGRNGLTKAWTAVLPLAGGVMSGALSLSGNASSNLHAVPFQQLNTAIATAVSGYVPITGTTMTGLLVLSGNAGSNLNPVPLQQVNAMLGTYAPLDNAVLTGDPRAPTPATSDNDTSIATTAYVTAKTAVYVPLAGGTMSGRLDISQNGTIPAAAGALLHVTPNNGVAGLAVIDTFAGINIFPTLKFRKSEGSAASPGAVLINDVLGDVVFEGYDGAGYQFGAQIFSTAIEPWTATAHGSAINFSTVNPGTTVVNVPLTLGRGVMVGIPPGQDPGVGNIALAGNLTLNNHGFVFGKDAGGVAHPLLGIDTDNSMYLGDSTTQNLLISPLTVFAKHTYPVTNNTYLVGNTGAAWANVVSYIFTTASDLRQKTDIAELPACLDLVQAIKPKRYKFNNARDEDKDRVRWGFVAQDVAAAMNNAGHDFGGHIVGDDEEQSQALSYSDLTAVLWKAVRELSEQVSELQAKVT